MTEANKTIIYIVSALVVAGAAYLSRPQPEVINVNEQVGKPLFENFDDPDKAASIEIVKYDEELGELRDFKVAREKTSGAWTIPSHAGYPADAETRMRDAALMLVDLQVLGVASEVAGDHRMFGVVEPDRETLKVGDEGVGLLLNFEDGDGQDLAGAIIGKKVKGTEDQRFIRRAGQDVVYTVKIDPDKLTTKFEDWIEKDLLDMNAWDVEDLTFKNYAVERTLNGAALNKNFDIGVDYEGTDWQLANFVRYTNNQASPASLEENQELNTQKLNDVKSAVDSLEIADVYRKPSGLGRDLKAGEGFSDDDESILDLQKRGFYVASVGTGGRELFSANGEVHVGMKDGVQYVLRFGETLSGQSVADSDGRSRYLFVTARVDMSKMPQPDLEPLPEMPGTSAEPPAKNAPAEEAAPKEAPAEEAPAEEAPAKEAPAEEAPAKEAPAKEAPAKEAPAEEPPAAKTESNGTSADEDATETAVDADEPTADTPPAEEPAAEPEAKPADDPASAEAKPGDQPKEANAKPADAKPADAEPKAKTESPTTATDLEAMEAEFAKEKARITKDNQRKMDEWKEKVDKAKGRVAELNTRFGDWYYVVSEEQYGKIFLSLDDIIKAKEGEGGAAADDAASGDDIDAFRSLQGLGLPKP